MSAPQIIGAWAQPALGRTRRDLPEVVRLLEKSGTTEFLDEMRPCLQARQLFIDTSAYMPQYCPQQLLQFLRSLQAGTKLATYEHG